MGSCLSAESRSPIPGSPTSPAKHHRSKNSSKRRNCSRNSSFGDLSLHRIPGRLFTNGFTDMASLFTQQGKKGTNQDAMIVWENFGSRTDTIFCGVFDGHGPYGHMVAKKVRDSLPLRLSAHWEVNLTTDDVHREISLNNTGSMNSDEATSFLSADEEFRASIDVDGTEKQPEIFHTLKESFLKAFRVMDWELRMHQTIDSFCSGTTAVTIVKQGQDLVIGNVGDSRAVLGMRDKGDSLVPIQLTVDLKPNLPAEAERIRKCRGRVFALQDEPDVARVWLPNSNSPGLAMARAFGDFCLKDFGLISVPEISYRRLTEKDEFIVLATDGIWDVLSNKEVVDIVASAPKRTTAARTLVETAVKAWKHKYPTSKIDDCAVVCLFLDSNSGNLSSSASNTKPEEQQSSADHFSTPVENEDLSCPNGLNRSGTVRTSKEILQDGSEEDETKEEEHSETGIEWSALEGVSRVNTLVTLPRFNPGKEDRKGRK
ncbi:hypothetical protein IC582_010834 [Cucumis melo]|uniref:Probable protein phosphatase 2C 33 n=1 Tax=Cucumis melo TaxID=3656 RepID=A0A1S3B4U6_CUCME|nr:probable protein phosphatase 2C 33 [Cucumis melo]